MAVQQNKKSPSKRGMQLQTMRARVSTQSRHQPVSPRAATPSGQALAEAPPAAILPLEQVTLLAPVPLARPAPDGRRGRSRERSPAAK